MIFIMARSATQKPSDARKKSQIVSVRLDPQLKYLAELAARRQRRPLSSFIEWAVEQTLSKVSPSHDPSSFEESASFTDIASELWDVDEPDRFVKLALRFPDLLDHQEQRLWKLIRDNGALWRGRFHPTTDEWEWEVSEKNLRIETLRDLWTTFQKVAADEEPAGSLPTWEKTNPDIIPF